MSAISDLILSHFGEKEFRDSYVEGRTRNLIAYQIRAMREQRGWSQAELATRLGKPQSVVSRLEDPDYGRLTLTTLLEVAAAFDVGLSVRFVAHDEFLASTSDLTAPSLEVAGFSEKTLDDLRRAQAENATATAIPPVVTPQVMDRFPTGELTSFMMGNWQGPVVAVVGTSNAQAAMAMLRKSYQGGITNSSGSLIATDLVEPPVPDNSPVTRLPGPRASNLSGGFNFDQGNILLNAAEISQ